MNIKIVRYVCWILVCVCAFLRLSAQEPSVDKQSKHRVYTEAIESQGSANDLFFKAKEWVMKTFKSADEVIRLEDPESGQLILDGQSVLFLYESSGHADTLTLPIHFVLDIQTIGGAYRYTLDQIQVNCYPENPEIEVPFEVLSQDSEDQKKHIRNVLAEIKPDLSESEIRSEETRLLQRYQECRSKGNATLEGIIGLLKRHMNRK